MNGTNQNQKKEFEGRDATRARLTAIGGRLEAVEGRLNVLSDDNKHWAEWAKNIDRKLELLPPYVFLDP